MPIIRADQRGSVKPPEWSDIAHYGISRLQVGKEVELHYHDVHEYWVIVSGKGICTTEGDEYEIGPGDMVLTRAGDEHSLVVTEEMVAVYIYGRMAPGDTLGHKHRNDRGQSGDRERIETHSDASNATSTDTRNDMRNDTNNDTRTDTQR